MNKSQLKEVLIALTFSWCFVVLSNAQNKPEFAFQDTTLNVNIRVTDLLMRLTTEEKCSFLLFTSPAIPRLGIPQYNWWNEALHGVARNGKATVFPQSICLAATFNPALTKTEATAISDEARAKHHAAVKIGNRSQYSGLSFWSPNINIFRDPRWGRGQETFGEDPYLTSQIGVAFVKGLQGNNPNYLKTGACAKHYAVHSGPENLRHKFNVNPSETDFRETYLPAFKALVDAGVGSVMCAYNRVDNKPCCGSKTLLGNILRNEMGFRGQIVSDCWALSDFSNGHNVVKNDAEASAMAVKAGVNVECGESYQHLKDALSQNLITEKEIDEVLKPTLELRIKLGLLNPGEECPYSNISTDVVNSDKHHQIARQVAQEGMVLLKNNGILPLSNNMKKVFITGPTASDNDLLNGNYNGIPGEPVSFLSGIMRQISPGTSVEYRKGCELTSYSDNGISLASSADVTIACIGITPLMEGEEGDAVLSDNNGDRKSTDLPENQIKFLREMRKWAGKKPIVAVVTGGSAISMPTIDSIADAVIYAWYPGEQGGNALADILFGKISPSGKLPITIYNSVNDLPPFENYDMNGRTYRYFTGKALYPFGYGLSYTNFEYSDVKVDKSKYKENEEITIELDVTNTGKFDGKEVVQVYIKDSFTGSPIKSLKAFEKPFLKQEEKQHVVLKLPVSSLAHWNKEKQKYEVKKGEYQIQVGSSSADIKKTTIIKIQ